MDRDQKILKIKALEDQIKQQSIIIEKEKEKLKTLKDKLSKEYISKCPILLFIVDETLPMPDDERDYEYEYVYYCPDIDGVKCIKHHSSIEFLPNFIDLRDFFKDMQMPKRMYCGRDEKFFKIVNYSVPVLRHIINDIFDSNTINSWEDLVSFLKNLSDNYTAPKYEDIEKADKARTLKP